MAPVVAVGKMVHVPVAMPPALALVRSVLFLLCCAVLLFAFFYVPFQRWLLRRVRIPIRRWLRRRRSAIRARYDDLVNTLMGRMINQVAPVIAETLPESGLRARPLIAEAALKWWRAALWAIPARALSLLILVYCTANLEAIVDFIRNPPKDTEGLPHDAASGSGHSYARDAPPPDPLGALLKGMKDAAAWIIHKAADGVSAIEHLWYLAPSWGIFTPLTYLVLILTVLLALKALYPFAIALTNGARQIPPENSSRQRSPRRARHPATVDDEARYRPVVVLLLTAADCARTWRAWGQGSPLNTPRVSVRRAEYVIRNAWRTGCAYNSWSERARQRHALKAHAAKVIGALRTVGARQYTDPDIGMVLQELADMLLTIAERYVEGRIGQLLDDVDIVEAATDYEWLRLLGVGAFGVGALVAASMANLPEEANGVLVGLALLLAGSWLFRHKLTHPMDLIDVLRGADRK